MVSKYGHAVTNGSKELVFYEITKFLILHYFFLTPAWLQSDCIEFQQFFFFSVYAYSTCDSLICEIGQGWKWLNKCARLLSKINFSQSVLCVSIGKAINLVVNLIILNLTEITTQTRKVKILTCTADFPPNILHDSQKRLYIVAIPSTLITRLVCHVIIATVTQETVYDLVGFPSGTSLHQSRKSQ